MSIQLVVRVPDTDMLEQEYWCIHATSDIYEGCSGERVEGCYLVVREVLPIKYVHQTVMIAWLTFKPHSIGPFIVIE